MTTAFANDDGRNAPGRGPTSRAPMDPFGSSYEIAGGQPAVTNFHSEVRISQPAYYTCPLQKYAAAVLSPAPRHSERGLWEMIDDIVEDGHVRAAKNALRSTNGLLNDWEINFLQSMLSAKWPSPRQLTTLELRSLKHIIWQDWTLHLPSRLAGYMVEVSSRSRKVYLKPETMMRTMAASCAEIDLALRTITEQWGLFC
jgi:hypothetical protein